MMMLPNQLQFIRELYKTDYVVSSLYASTNDVFQIFEMKDSQLQTLLVNQLMQTREEYHLVEDKLWYIRPYEIGISLEDWLLASHTLTETITLCENLIFELMQQELPKPLLATTIQLSSIAVTETKRIVLFRQPHFLCLRHESQINLYQECAEVCYQLLVNSAELHHRRYRWKKQWKLFEKHVDEHSYTDYEPVVDDIVRLKRLNEKKHYDFSNVIEIATYVFLTIVLIGFATLGVIKLQDYLHQTYERLPYIGKQPTKL